MLVSAGRIVRENPRTTATVATVTGTALVGAVPAIIIAPVLAPLGFVGSAIVPGMHPLLSILSYPTRQREKAGHVQLLDRTLRSPPRLNCNGNSSRHWQCRRWKRIRLHPERGCGGVWCCGHRRCVWDRLGSRCHWSSGKEMVWLLTNSNGKRTRAAVCRPTKSTGCSGGRIVAKVQFLYQLAARERVHAYAGG